MAKDFSTYFSRIYPVASNDQEVSEIHHSTVKVRIVLEPKIHIIINYEESATLIYYSGFLYGRRLYGFFSRLTCSTWRYLILE